MSSYFFYLSAKELFMFLLKTLFGCCFNSKFNSQDIFVPLPIRIYHQVSASFPNLYSYKPEPATVLTHFSLVSQFIQKPVIKVVRPVNQLTGFDMMGNLVLNRINEIFKANFQQVLCISKDVFRSMSKIYGGGFLPKQFMAFTH